MAKIATVTRRILPLVLPYALAGLLLLPIVMLAARMSDLEAQAAQPCEGQHASPTTPETSQLRPWWFGRAL